MNIVRAVDARVDLSPPTMVVFESVPSVQFQQIPPSQPSNNPVITIPITPGFGLGRSLAFQTQMTFTITGTALNLFTEQQCVSLRAFPINQCLTNLNIQLGTNGVQITPNLYTSAFLQYNNNSLSQRQNQSGTASAPDETTSYEPMVGTVASPFANGLDENQSSSVNSVRTKQLSNFVVNGTNTTLTFTANIIEDLIASPFLYNANADPAKAIFNLNNVIITMSFNYLQRMLSYSIPAGATVTAVNAVFNSQSILCQFVAPFENSITNRTMPTAYNYTYIQSTDTTIANLPAGATIQISTNTQQLSIIPDTFLIYCIPSVESLTSVSPSLPDFFFPITQVNINLGMRQAILGQASQYQLWQIYKKNGGIADWPRFSGQPIVDSTGVKGFYGSSPLILRTSEDLNLPKSSTAGEIESSNFQANVTVYNNTGVNFTNCTIRVVALTDGWITTAGAGNVDIHTGGVTMDMVHAASGMNYVTEQSVRTASNGKGYSGGGFWSDFKKGFHSVMKPASQIASALSPYVSAFAPEYAPEIAMGTSALQALNQASGGRLMARNKIRGAIRNY
jgi:hypothetical protein